MAVWAEITLKPWGQHGELGTGKTHVEVDVRRREQRGARELELKDSVWVLLPAGAWRSTSSGGRHGRGQGRGWRAGMGLWESSRRKSRSSQRTTSAEIEIKPGNGVRVWAEVEIKPPDIELEPETGRHDGNKSRASVMPCWRRLTPCWLDYELEMRGRNPDYLADKPPLSPDPGSNHPLYHVAPLSSLQDPRVPLPFISGHALSLPYFGSY
uniref:Uncharacterized protein n=1 Tax=Oryza sativa subsp. japonica TaxID=39947 RepID=Q6F2W6_ORYSJ|nr:hypothetical protein [Oryza sativa Japonica Group]